MKKMMKGKMGGMADMPKQCPMTQKATDMSNRMSKGMSDDMGTGGGAGGGRFKSKVGINAPMNNEQAIHMEY